MYIFSLLWKYLWMVLFILNWALCKPSTWRITQQLWKYSKKRIKHSMALHYLRKINHIRKVGESRNCSHLESSSKTIQERVVRTSVLVPLICFQEAPWSYRRNQALICGSFWTVLSTEVRSCLLPVASYHKLLHSAHFLTHWMLSTSKHWNQTE